MVQQGYALLEEHCGKAAQQARDNGQYAKQSALRHMFERIL
jgi:hypothetical protein